MSLRRSPFKPLGFELAPGYAAITELSRARRRRRPGFLWWAAAFLTAIGTAALWIVR